MISINLDHSLWLEADNRFVHLVHVSVHAEPDPSEPSAPDWVNSWSIDARRVPELQQAPPEFFPALNVAALARMLDFEAKQAAGPEPLAETAVFLEIR